MLTPPDGVYAQIPVCRPADWLHAVEFALSLPTVEAYRRRLRVAGPATVLAAARQWAAAADRHTGRDVAVAHETVALAIGYAPATVKRAMRFLKRLGLVVEVARGRNYLTLDELAAARALGAHGQRAVGSTWALTIPSSVDGTPLPPLGLVNKKSLVKKGSPKRARGARKAGAPHRPASEEKKTAIEPAGPRTTAVQKFAGQLASRLPRLLNTPKTQPQRVYVRNPEQRTDAVWVGGRHIGHVCNVIERHRLVERGWTAHQMLERVDRYRATSRRDIDPADQRDPLAWLSWLIGQAIPADELAPHARAAAADDAQRTAAAVRAEQLRELRARIAGEHTEIDAILTAMHQQFPRKR